MERGAACSWRRAISGGTAHSLDKRNILVRVTRPWTEQDNGPVRRKPRRRNTTIEQLQEPSEAARCRASSPCVLHDELPGGGEERGSEGARLGPAGCPCGRSLRCERSLHPASVPYLDEGVVGSRDQVACAQAEMRRR